MWGGWRKAWVILHVTQVPAVQSPRKAHAITIILLRSLKLCACFFPASTAPLLPVCPLLLLSAPPAGCRAAEQLLPHLLRPAGRQRADRRPGRHYHARGVCNLPQEPPASARGHPPGSKAQQAAGPGQRRVWCTRRTDVCMGRGGSCIQGQRQFDAAAAGYGWAGCARCAEPCRGRRTQGAGTFWCACTSVLARLCWHRLAALVAQTVERIVTAG